MSTLLPGNVVHATIQNTDMQIYSLFTKHSEKLRVHHQYSDTTNRWTLSPNPKTI